RSADNVAVCERYGFLGGNLTVAKVGTICGLYVGDDAGEFDFVVGGIAREGAEAVARRGRRRVPLGRRRDRSRGRGGACASRRRRRTRAFQGDGRVPVRAVGRQTL